MTRLGVKFVAAGLSVVLPIGTAAAYEFLEKRECTLQWPARPPVHTTCVVSGGMGQGSIDVSVKTPDGNRYSLFGYLDRVDGWTLNNKRAVQTSHQLGQIPLCVKTADGAFELCLSQKVE